MTTIREQHEGDGTRLQQVSRMIVIVIVSILQPTNGPCYRKGSGVNRRACRVTSRVVSCANYVIDPRQPLRRRAAMSMNSCRSGMMTFRALAAYDTYLTYPAAATFLPDRRRCVQHVALESNQ
jgi:hypothetical protein